LGDSVWQKHVTTGSAGTIINGIVTSTTKGGGGNCELAINQLSTETSDWQLSKVYVWNVHLPDAVFAKASAKLNSYRDVLNSMEDPSIFLSFV
jgi:ammonia channel protein AmtB